jgi:hypothetical protein
LEEFMRPIDEAAHQWASRLADLKSIHPVLYKLAVAIKLNEGWWKRRGDSGPTRSYRNNNPGNLRWSPFMDKKIDNFAVFTHYHQGLYALMWDLLQKCLGNTSTGLSPESTLKELFDVYAPSEDDNDPNSYAQFVAGFLGVELEKFRLGDIVNA